MKCLINQDTACIEKCTPMWVNIGIVIYINYQRCFYGRQVNVKIDNGSIGIDGISTYRLGCIGCFAHLNVLMLLILIVLGLSIEVRNAVELTKSLLGY